MTDTQWKRYDVSAGNTELTIIARSFEKALKVVFKRFDAKTSEDLPKPFWMRQSIEDREIFVVGK